MEMVVEERKDRSSGDDGVGGGDGDIKDDDGVVGEVATRIVAKTIVGGVAIEEELGP